MNELPHPIPAWVTRGKTIQQLIEELQSFSNKDMEVRISIDYGDTHHCVSIIETHEDRFCVLVNAEDYHRDRWQEFMRGERPGTEENDGADDANQQ